MFIFILVVFLQQQPYPVGAFLEQFDSKQACMLAVEEVKKQVPEDKKDKVICFQAVNPKFIRDI
jgi:hypothetical protein